MDCRISTLVLLGILWQPFLLRGQQNLAALLNPQKEDYSLLTYSQHYLNKDNNAVEYAGTIYLKTESFTLNGCELAADVLVQDRFVGTEDTRKHLRILRTFIGQQAFTYRYSYRLNLKRTSDLQTSLILARPFQLRENTGFVCKEDPSCKLTWLHLKTSELDVQETRVVNGLVDFDRTVAEISIPATSKSAALEVEKYLNQAKSTCR